MASHRRALATVQHGGRSIIQLDLVGVQSRAVMKRGRHRRCTITLGTVRLQGIRRLVPNHAISAETVKPMVDVTAAAIVVEAMQ